MKSIPKIEKFGENAFLLRWKGAIDPSLNDEIVRVDSMLYTLFSEIIVETVPSFLEIAVYVKPNLDIGTLIKQIDAAFLAEVDTVPMQEKFVYDIPVCYDKDFGLDLAEMAKVSGLSVKKWIQLHTEPLYRVYFIGFLPGFPYLGGLPEALWFPRKKEPRQLIEKGSVGIGGPQTGIYTMDSPGGWNILGRTPFYFFDVNEPKPTLLQAGDYVRFVSITKTQFKKISIQIKEGNYILKKEVCHD
ncbi:MAG: 5-oxoprolinase subunit PxpB [Flavobacteriales bacterium]|nr:5-oxoprolinase subunit PxpB [Flavobacteriales bacterium]